MCLKIGPSEFSDASLTTETVSDSEAKELKLQTRKFMLRNKFQRLFVFKIRILTCLLCKIIKNIVLCAAAISQQKNPFVRLTQQVIFEEEKQSVPKHNPAKILLNLKKL